MTSLKNGPSTISVSFVKGCLASIDNRNAIDTKKKMLEQCEIRQEVLTQSKGRVRSDAFAKLLRLMTLEFDDEFLGFGKSVSKPGSFALMCQLAISAPTLRKALLRCIRLQSLLDLKPQLTLIEDGDEAILIVSGGRDKDTQAAFLYESLTVIYHRFSSWLINQAIVLKQVSFAYAKPTHLGEYKTLFPCNIEFSAPFTSLVFNREFLDFEIKKTDKDVTNYLRDAPSGVFAKPANDSSYSSRIREVFNQIEYTTPPTLDEIASGFAITPQTLRRRLKQEGTTYKALKEDIRRDMAIYLLTANNVPIKDISSRLGFAEPSAFQRAFKEWTGSTPAAYRSMR